MKEAREDEQFEKVVHKIDPQNRLLCTWKLEGGVSAHVAVLEMLQPDGQTKKIIVRQHGDRDLKYNPQIATDEFKLLQLLHALGLAVPMPYDLDQSGEILARPSIVMEYIEGNPEFILTQVWDFIPQLATTLFRIHQVGCTNPDLTFLPKIEERYTEMLRKRSAAVAKFVDEERIRETLEAVWPLPPRNHVTLLHGDFWPGNVLWKNGHLVAVIDWEDAARGDPLTDVANSRLEILWAFGSEAMDQFTSVYQSMTSLDFMYLPYWDLCAALRRVPQLSQWGLDTTTETAMHEKHRWFVRQAFETLSSSVLLREKRRYSD